MSLDFDAPGGAQPKSSSASRSVMPRAHSDICKGREPQRSLEQEVLRSHQMFHVTKPQFNPFSGSHQSHRQGGGGAWCCNRHKSAAYSCPGGQCAWLPHRLSTLGARDWTPAAQHREKAPWGWAPLTLKSPGAPEKSEGALPSNRDPKTPCESQEGSLLCSGQEAGRGDGLIPISLCAHPVSLSLWVLNPPAESPVSSLELKIPPGRQKSLSNRQRTLQSSPAFFLLVKHPSHCPLCLKRLCG